MSWLIGALIFWAGAWGVNIWLANSRWSASRAVRIAVPVLFGLLVPAYVLNVTVVPVWFVYTLARRLGRGLLLRLAYLAVLALAWLYAVATQDLYGALICFSLCGAAVGAMVLVDMRGILRAGIDPAAEQEARDALAKPVTAGD